MAIFDFDGDGLMDVFLPNGTTLDGNDKAEKATGHLYRNFTRTPRVRYVVAICARQVRDTRWGVDNDALVTGADVSRMVHDAFDRP